MKRLTSFSVANVLCNDFRGESQLQKATNVMNEIMSTPDKGIPHDLLDKAVCVGIIPSEVKFAFRVWWHLWTRRAGVPRGGNGQWDAPSMFTIGRGECGISDRR